MFEVFTNPSTLLCLGIVFILIAVLFFYFKRNIALLERAQMEQARLLQSFITNMEMTQHMVINRGGSHNPNNVNPNNVNQNNVNPNSISNEQRTLPRIDVSDDGSDSDSDSDSDNDSDSDSDSDNGIYDETPNNENVSYVSNEHNIIDVTQLDFNNTREIKVIQLQDNALEEVHSEILDINVLHSSDNESTDDISSEVSSIQDYKQSLTDSLSGEESQVVKDVKDVNKENLSSIDFKTLSVQTLRQMAEDVNMIQKGEKRTKKELIGLLEKSLTK
jgi:hypothetical protein